MRRLDRTLMSISPKRAYWGMHVECKHVRPFYTNTQVQKSTVLCAHPKRTMNMRINIGYHRCISDMVFIIVSSCGGTA